jgi:glycosyltransferase involved in cell wall biosynthesis
VIHNGVDTDRFAPKPLGRARIREELALTDQDFCIGCVGNLFPVKDHITVLRALASLNPEGGRWRLLMVGEGPELGMLQNFINAHPTLGNHVQFLGSSNRVPELLNAMDVYVLPSLIEGLSNSLLEAMATGLPVIATATGGNPEVAVDDESGLLFPVGDFRGLAERLTLVRTRPDLRRKLAQRALLRVREQFSTESMIGNYEQLYAGLGAKAGAAPIRVAAGT